MALFTIDEVMSAAARETGSSLREAIAGEPVFFSRVDSFFEKQAAEARRVSVQHFDIFFSHAYADKTIVSGIYAILRATGFSVYVDWIHDRHRLNRANVTAANAAILRERMDKCGSLLYTTTQQHSASKWMPWECGYFDGSDAKPVGGRIQPGHVAILPVVQSSTAGLVGQEYLGLYPVAQKANLLRRNLNIHNQQNPAHFFHFHHWVRNGHP